MAPQPFGLNHDPFASAELELDEATLLLQGRISAAGGDEKLILPEATCAEIYQLARGKRGGVFSLAARAMRIASGAGATTVEPVHVHEAAAEAAQAAAQQSEAAESARTIISAIDDVPDMPMAMSGGLALPSEPSADLEPDQRDWVARFITHSPAPRGLSSLGQPTTHDVSTPRPVKRVEAPAPKPVSPPEQRPATPKPSLAVSAADPSTTVATDQASTSDPAGIPPRRLSPETTARIKNSRGGRRRGAPPAVVGGLAVIAAVAVGAVVFHLVTGATRGTKPAKAFAATETIPATTSDASVAVQPAPAPVEAPAAADPPAPAPKKKARPVGATPAESQASYGIELATYIDGDRANEERGRIAASGYSVRIINASEDSSSYYRLVAGPYPSRAAAEQAADAMLASGLVQQARVVPIHGE
jgi:hypothetical protein